MAQQPENTVRIKKYPRYFLSLDGKVYDSEDDWKQLKSSKHAETGLFMYTFVKGNSVHAWFVTDTTMEEHFPGGKMPASGGSGPKTKPFVVFDITGKFIGRFATQQSLVDTIDVIAKTNGIPPVLKGRVRTIAGHHLFYAGDWSDGEADYQGYDSWLAQDKTRKEGDFPHEIHAQFGWVFGRTRRVPVEEAFTAIKAAQKQPAEA